MSMTTAQTLHSPHCPSGDGAAAFRRTASRLVEMQSADYLRHSHAVHDATVELRPARA